MAMLSRPRDDGEPLPTDHERNRNAAPCRYGRVDHRARRTLPAGRGGNALRPATQPACRSPRIGRDAACRRDPRNARGNRLARHAVRTRRRVSLGSVGQRRDVHSLRVLRRRGAPRRGAAARRRHPARGLADGGGDRGAARVAPQPARHALHRRLLRGPALAARVRDGDALPCRGASA